MKIDELSRVMGLFTLLVAIVNTARYFLFGVEEAILEAIFFLVMYSMTRNKNG